MLYVGITLINQQATLNDYTKTSESLAQELKEEQEYKEELEYNYARYLLCSSLKRMCKIKDKKTRKELLQKTWKKLNCNFPNWKKNRILNTVNIDKNKYMKTINKFTYKIYTKVFEII